MLFLKQKLCLLLTRAQNTLLGGGWKGIATDGRYASDASTWICTHNTAIAANWASPRYNDREFKPPVQKVYNWMCPAFPKQAMWLWTNKFYNDTDVYCRLHMMECEYNTQIMQLLSYLTLI